MSEFQKIQSDAVAAGMAAVAAAQVKPMVVIGGGQEYFVEDGVCGFAWVNVKPGNSPFANFLKKQNLAKKDSYYGGVCVWVGGFGQSMQKKEAYARAYAKVLQANGINAYASSRMD